MRIFNKGFNYSQDGPGNRLVYHLQGCNFRCKWCSNPEGIGKRSTKMKEASVEEMTEEILSAKAMFFDGGGITLTGGEATMQFDEVKLLLEKMRELKINTAIETNGSNSRLCELFNIVDHLIMDIKHFNSNEHLYWTGNDGLQTYKNLDLICKSGIKALIRIPLIKHVNLSAEGFLKFFENFDCKNISFEFLAYHEYGKGKWQENYEITDGFISNEDYKNFVKQFKNNGYNVVNT